MLQFARESDCDFMQLVDKSTSIGFTVRSLTTNNLAQKGIMEERLKPSPILINRINRNIRKIKNQEMAAYNLKASMYRVCII